MKLKTNLLIRWTHLLRPFFNVLSLFLTLKSTFAGGYESCLDLKQQTGVDRDGEYQILFAGKNITVFCHQMNTSLPKEYLTLHSGEKENFSEIYGKRLMEPNSCPNNGTRNDDCECVSDAQRRQGFTSFNKIKLNVTSLKVNSRFLFFYVWFKEKCMFPNLQLTTSPFQLKSEANLSPTEKPGTATARPTALKEGLASTWPELGFECHLTQAGLVKATAHPSGCSEFQ